MSIKNIQVQTFQYGIIDSVEDTAIPRGACSASLNFITRGTKIELRRGSVVLGDTEIAGTGRVSGLATGKKPDGTDILFRTRKRKAEYFDTTTNDWVEIGSDLLPAAVVAADSLGEDISIEPYVNATGPQMWLNSPNAGPWKIMTANPANATSMYVLGKNYKAYFRIKLSRAFAWKRAGSPPNRNDIFASKLDEKAAADYTQIVSEAIGTGNGVLKTFTGTLAFKAAGTRRICFEMSATDTVETFTDNGDGTLTGSLGGTGTINYTTGAFSLTFNTAPMNTQAITATYRWADDSADGIANFEFSSTRVAGEGFILKQPQGGAMQDMSSLNGTEYCLHERVAYAVTISADDTDLTNLVFRTKVGIPNKRASVETADGIYYIDDNDENDPQFRLLTLATTSTEVLPRSVSKQFTLDKIKVGVDLTGYSFDRAATIEFGDFILFACRTKNSAINNRVFVYDKTTKATDVLDYSVSCFALYNGTLVAGDSVSDNVYTLFSGYDDAESSIYGFWEASQDNMGFEGMKRTVELILDGDVGPEQGAKILMSVDRAPFVEVRSQSDIAAGKSAIEGDGAYVDKSQRVDIGSLTLGRGEIGGGGDGLEAYHYRRSFRIQLDKFEYVKFRVEPLRLGYLSLSELTFRDVRVKWGKIPNKYQVGR